jgi:hypothetical protein
MTESPERCSEGVLSEVHVGPGSSGLRPADYGRQNREPRRTGKGCSSISRDRILAPCSLDSCLRLTHLRPLTPWSPKSSYKGAVRVEVLESSHSPFLSMPEKVVEVVEKAL